MLGIRLLLIGIVSATLIGAGAYVLKLRSDNAILKIGQNIKVKLVNVIPEERKLVLVPVKNDKKYK